LSAAGVIFPEGRVVGCGIAPPYASRTALPEFSVLTRDAFRGRMYEKGALFVTSCMRPGEVCGASCTFSTGAALYGYVSEIVPAPLHAVIAAGAFAVLPWKIMTPAKMMEAKSKAQK